MSGELLYIVDDASNTMTLSGGQWRTVTIRRWYNGTHTGPPFAILGNKATDTSTQYGSLNYTFHGTSIAFMGNTHQSNNSRIILVTIDGNSPYNTSYDNPGPQNSQQWYQSPHLDDGVHTIRIDNISTTVDIVVISAGPSTPLSGQTVIVDDDDPSIIYSGNWKRNSSSFIMSDGADGPPSGGFPFHNGTHQSTTPGDTASIHFTGNSVAVYGIFPWAAVGSMSVTYTLDNSNSTKIYKVTSSSPEFVAERFQQEPNFLFFSENSLAPGDHTLSIKITEINNLAFVMDYLTYSPSFNFLTTKSNITSTPTTPAPSKSPSTSLPTNSSSSTSAPSKTGHVGGIVGGVAGAVVALALAFFITYKRRRGNWTFLREAGLKSGRHRSVVKPYLLAVPPTGADATLPVPESRDELKRPLDSSLTTSNPQRPIANLQEDTLQRIRVVEALIAELEMTPGNDRASRDNQARINRLRQRIDELTQGSLHSNAGDPPPAYGASTL